MLDTKEMGFSNTELVVLAMRQKKNGLSAQRLIDAAVHHAFAYEFFDYFYLSHAEFWLVL